MRDIVWFATIVVGGTLYVTSERHRNDLQDVAIESLAKNALGLNGTIEKMQESQNKIADKLAEVAEAVARISGGLDRVGR
jgi:hypothetical protein